MIKKLYNPKWILLFIAAFFLAQEIREVASGRKTFIFYKWLFNDLDYAQNMQVETYLLSDRDTLSLLKDQNKEVIQPIWDELSTELLNRVIRIKNNGNRKVWGKLHFSRIRDGFDFEPYDLYVDLTRTEDKHISRDYIIFVFQRGSDFHFGDLEPPPPLTYYWKELYTTAVGD